MQITTYKQSGSLLLKTYYRLTKPGIVYGNVMTAAAGFLFAARWHVDLWLLLALLGGTALVIASGCVFNNYLDRGIDQKMARTKKRALVTGLVPLRYAIIYACCLAILGFAILLYTNALVMLIGFLALFSYVIVYGIAKRHSAYGTLVGTVPGAATLVAGYAAVTNRLDLGALLLFILMVAWQMPHFFAIAIRRLSDYKAAGLPVWPIKKGVQSTKVQILIYIGIFAISNGLFSLLGYAGYVYAVVMVGLSCYWLFRGLQGWQKQSDDTKWAGSMFGLSLVILLSLSCMLVIGPLLP